MTTPSQPYATGQTPEELDAMMLAAGWRKSADGKRYEIEAMAPPEPQPTDHAPEALPQDVKRYLTAIWNRANDMRLGYDEVLDAAHDILKDHFTALCYERASLTAERDALYARVTNLERLGQRLSDALAVLGHHVTTKVCAVLHETVLTEGASALKAWAARVPRDDRHAVEPGDSCE